MLEKIRNIFWESYTLEELRTIEKIKKWEIKLVFWDEEQTKLFQKMNQFTREIDEMKKWGDLEKKLNDVKKNYEREIECLESEMRNYEQQAREIEDIIKLLN